MNIKKLGTEESKAKKQIEKVKEIAEEMIQNARAKAKKLRSKERIDEMAEDIVEGKQEEMTTRAKKIKRTYEKRVEKMENVPEAKIEEVAEKIVEEVLSFE